MRSTRATEEKTSVYDFHHRALFKHFVRGDSLNQLPVTLLAVITVQGLLLEICFSKSN